MISDKHYLDWQAKIAAKKFFRRFWIFWAIYSVVVVFLAALYFLYLGQVNIVILAAMAFVLARVIFSPLIYRFYKKSRPYQKLNFQTIHSILFSAVTKKDNSFPSDHAASFASITAVFAFYFPLLGLFLIIIAVLNGIGRIILGYHYWADVLAGWVLGVLSAVIVIFYLGPLILK